MSGWYFYNKKDEKVGPVPVTTIKLLAQQGIISRETVVENKNGRSLPAGQVKGLFPEPTIEPQESAIAPLEDISVEEPAFDEIYGVASLELPKPPPVAPRSIAHAPFTMPVNDNPFALDPSVVVPSAPTPPKRKPAEIESADPSPIEESYVYAVEKWIRKNPSLVERIVERIVILLAMLLLCFRILPAIVLLWLLILWFAFDLVRQIKKGNDDS